MTSASGRGHFSHETFPHIGSLCVSTVGVGGKKTITWSSSDKHTFESMLGLLGFRGATYSWSDGKWRSGMENLKTAIKVSRHYFLKFYLAPACDVAAVDILVATLWTNCCQRAISVSYRSTCLTGILWQRRHSKQGVADISCFLSI